MFRHIARVVLLDIVRPFQESAMPYTVRPCYTHSATNHADQLFANLSATLLGVDVYKFRAAVFLSSQSNTRPQLVQQQTMSRNQKRVLVTGTTRRSSDGSRGTTSVRGWIELTEHAGIDDRLSGFVKGTYSRLRIPLRPYSLEIRSSGGSKTRRYPTQECEGFLQLSRRSK